jgi:hypothetical protein
MSRASIHSYQEAIFIGPTNPHQDHHSENTFVLEKVQNSNAGIVPGLNSILNLERKNDSYYGNPQISFEVTYYATNGFNERNIGLYTNGLDALTGVNSGCFINLENCAPNIFIVKSDVGKEGLKDTSSSKKIIGLGNCSLLNYSFSASVGSFATSSASFNALNIASFDYTTGAIVPSVVIDGTGHGQRETYPVILPVGSSYSIGAVDYDVNPANLIDVIGPQDIVISFPSGSSMFSKQHEDFGLHVQSVNLTFETLRQDLFTLGKYFPVKRPLQYPLKVALSIDTIVSDLEIYDIFNVSCRNNKKDISIYLKKHCSDVIGMEFHLKGAELVNYTTSNAVNGRRTASLQYEISINDAHDESQNFFIRACQGTESYIPVETSVITGYSPYGYPEFETVTTYKKIYQENAL